MERNEGNHIIKVVVSTRLADLMVDVLIVGVIVCINIKRLYNEPEK